jgi:hypothetical protein
MGGDGEFVYIMILEILLGGLRRVGHDWPIN